MKFEYKMVTKFRIFGSNNAPLFVNKKQLRGGGIIFRDQIPKFWLMFEFSNCKQKKIVAD